MKKKSEPKKIESLKIYAIKVINYDDGTSEMQRRNDGFNILELIGLVHHLQKDFEKQFEGLIKPDIIKREVVE